MSEKSSPLISFVSGAVSGVGIVLSGHPLDTIKVYLQTPIKNSNHKCTFLGAIKDIYRTEVGISGFYKGMSAPLIGVSPLIATSFWGYSVGKKFFEKPDYHLTYFEYFLAGIISGCFTTPIITPFDRIKCLLQIQTPASVNRRPLDYFKQIIKNEGVKGLYRGFIATFIRGIYKNISRIMSLEKATKMWAM
ncbi:hypothetical protein HZS_7579 [Henneguya salminicola]|nr:hypothetical protein HZS_7579 [Henneguya salminicola]